MYKKIMVLLFAVMLFALPLWTFLSQIGQPAQPFSENENRYLDKFPTISVDKITSKEFMNGFDNYYSDRFALRENWIVAKNDVEKTLGKTEINGIFTVNDRMMQVWKSYDENYVNGSIKAIRKFADKYSDIPVYFMLAPNAQEIYSDTLPANAGVASQKSFIKYVYDNLTNVTGIDVYSNLATNRDDYIYYRTDHHWTSMGAFLAYQSAGNAMNYTPYDLNSFSIEHASNVFRGTLYSKTLDSSVTPDVIDYYTLTKDEPNVKVTVFSGTNSTTYDSLYFRDYLDKKDKYSSFLGSNSPMITIESDIKDSQGSLLIFKDSYAHSLVPFLTKHYSKITILDLRYINTSFTQLVDVKSYSKVLFMYNVITFSESTDLKKLNFDK